MATDNQIAVKKRLIYAEDLFEPVDFKVFIAGRSGGKTMAMYEQIFRQRVEMAPTIDAVPVVHGEWHIDRTFMPFSTSCSECGCTLFEDGAWEWNYCPNCGAKMDGGKDNGC